MKQMKKIMHWKFQMIKHLFFVLILLIFVVFLLFFGLVQQRKIENKICKAILFLSSKGIFREIFLKFRLLDKKIFTMGRKKGFNKPSNHGCGFTKWRENQKNHHSCSSPKFEKIDQIDQNICYGI